MSAPHEEAHDKLADAAVRAAERLEEGKRHPEPSLGERLGQIGILGWTTIVPILAGLMLGRWLDRVFGARIMFAAAFLFVGAAVGLWAAWRWMQRTTP